VEAAVWLLTDDFPKWARFQGVAHSLTTNVLGLLFIGGYTVTTEWKALNFARWGLGLLFIGAAVSPFAWPEKVVEIPPRTVASCKEVAPQTLTTTLPPPQRGWIMDFGEMPPDILRVRVNHEVQLALVAWLKDDTTDHMTDYHIEKSNLFSPYRNKWNCKCMLRSRSCAEQCHNLMSCLR